MATAAAAPSDTGWQGSPQALRLAQIGPIGNAAPPAGVDDHARRDMHIPSLSVAVTLVSVNLPTIDPGSVLLRLAALLPLIGGYMVARESRGSLPLEIIAVVLLVLATAIPPTVNATVLPSLGPAILDRLPAALLLLGLAFVRDGGFKMIVGLALMAVSGLILLPQA